MTKPRRVVSSQAVTLTPEEARDAAAAADRRRPWRHVLVACDRCGEAVESDVPADTDARATAVLRALLATHGWGIGYSGEDDLCPDCIAPDTAGPGGDTERSTP